MECYGRRKLKYWRKTCTSATPSTKNPIRNGSVSNLGLCSKMPATNGRKELGTSSTTIFYYIWLNQVCYML